MSSFPRKRRADENPDRASPGGGGDASSYTLSLSLFVLLLAFFIVLTANAPVNPAKSTPILRNINETFSDGAPLDSDVPARIRDQDGLSIRGTDIDAIEGIFTSAIIPFDSQKIKGSGALRVRVPEKALQRFLDAPEREESQSFFARMAVALSPPAGGTRFRLDLVANIAGRPGEDDSETAAAILRAERLVMRLLEDGLVTGDQIAIGLQQGDAGQIDLFFTPQSPAPLSTDTLKEGTPTEIPTLLPTDTGGAP